MTFAEWLVENSVDLANTPRSRAEMCRLAWNAAQLAMRERAADVIDGESELDGEMPAEIFARCDTRDADTVIIFEVGATTVMRACVVSTKRNIAEAIRALEPE